MTMDYRFMDHLFNLGDLFDFKRKAANKRNQILYYLNRTQQMFKWENLPDTIPQRMIELYLQVNGHVGFYHYQDHLYCFRGALGGVPDEYYMPTIFTIANPALDLNVNAKIGEDCVVIPNDSLYIGLLPLLDRYVSLIAENDLSIDIGIINSRIIDLITATDDRSKKSAEKYLEDIQKGIPGVISSSEFLEGIKAQPYGSTSVSNHLTNLIEMEQYLKASLWNELGLNANYNMKRESLNSAESQLNNDALLPLVDDMLKQRQEGAERINAMFGTDIRVDLASAWEDNQEEIDLEQEQLSDDTDPAADDPDPAADDPADDSQEEGDDDE